MNSLTRKKTVSVIPLIPLPNKRSAIFSYTYTKKIPMGSLIKAPFGRRTIQGVVVRPPRSGKKIPDSKLKKIISITEESTVTSEQLRLCEYIAKEYCSPIGVVLKSCTPKNVKERFRKKNNKTEINTIRFTQHQRSAIEKILNAKKPAYLFGPPSSGKTEIYIQVIQEKLKNGGQALILLPELTLTPQIEELFRNRLGNIPIRIIHSKISKGALSTAWKDIRSGEARVIIGSRMALFAPYTKLKCIIVDEEQDISFKQWDMIPKYDARRVASKLAELHQSSLVYVGATPSLEYFWAMKLGALQRVNIPELVKLQHPNIQSPGKSLHIVDMRKERSPFSGRKTKYPPLLSMLLVENIRQTISAGDQFFLLVNRKGISQFSLCTECRTPLLCPHCQSALSYQEDGTYACLHCSHKTSAFPKCSKCHNMAFKNIGIGTQRVQKAIQKMFPSATIARADSSSMKSAGSQEQLFHSLINKDIDILIGTQMITKGWNLPRLSGVGIIDADSLWDMPDFRSDERALQLIIHLLGRIGRISSVHAGTAIIQTFSPEKPLLKNAVSDDLESFYLGELGMRKVLHYPPYWRVVKIIGRHENENRLTREMMRLEKQLRNRLPKHVQLQLIENPLRTKLRLRFQRYIIIKFPVENFFNELPSFLQKELANLPTNWHADIDPISLV